MPFPTLTVDPLETTHVTDGYAFLPTDFARIEKIRMSKYEPSRCREENCDGIKNVYTPLADLLYKFGERNVDGQLRIQYKRMSGETSLSAPKADGTERAYPLNSVSAGQMWREVRAAVYHGTLMDFDQESSHQALVLSALKMNPDGALSYAHINRYVTNKKAERQRIADAHFGGDMSKAKDLFTKITFGGKSAVKDELVVGMQLEFAMFCNLVVEANPGLHAKFKKRTATKNKVQLKAACAKYGITEEAAKEKGFGHKKWQASLMSLWCRNKESMVIEAVLGWCIRRNLVRQRRFDNSFDGLMIPIDDVKQFLATSPDHKTVDDITESFRKVGLAATGYDVRWSKKCMKAEHDTFWKEYGEFEKSVEVKPDCEEFPDVVKSLLKMKSSAQRFKFFNENFQYIEDQHKVLHYQILGIRRGDGSIVHERNLLWASRQQLYDTFGHIPSLTNNDRGDDIPLASMWFNSSRRSQYKRIGAYPYAGCYDPEKSAFASKDVFNTFVGYPPDVWENASDTEFTEEEMMDKIGPFLQLASHLAGCKCYDKRTGLFPKSLSDYDEADLEQLKLLLYFLGHRIAHPDWERLPFYVCIMSDCGAGKNMLFMPINRLVGGNHYKCSSNISDYVGGHAEGLISKIVAVFNEVDISASSKVTQEFKELITENTQTANPKFVRPFEFAVWAAIVVLTNSRIPIRIEPMNRERRIILFQSNDWTCKRWGSEMWGFYARMFNDVSFLRALRQFFTTRDYKGFDFRRARKSNMRQPAYVQLAMHFTPVEVMFVRDFIERGQFDLRFRDSGLSAGGEDGETPGVMPDFWTFPSWDQPYFIKVREAHQMARSYYEENSIHNSATARSQVAFTQHMERMKGVDKVIKSKIPHFRMVPRIIFQDLVDKGLVDYDELEPGLQQVLSEDVEVVEDETPDEDQGPSIMRGMYGGVE